MTIARAATAKCGESAKVLTSMNLNSAPNLVERKSAFFLQICCIDRRRLGSYWPCESSKGEGT